MSAWDEITDEERATLPASKRVAHGLPAKSSGKRDGAPPPMGTPLSPMQFPQPPTATDVSSGRAPSPYSAEGIAAAKARYGKSS